MFGLTGFVFALLSVLVPCSGFLTPECADFTNVCMTTLTAALYNGSDFCSAMSEYFPCVSEEVTSAEAEGKCDPLTSLVKKVRELSTLNDLLASQSCDIGIPEGLQLDKCSREIGECGFSAVEASAATDSATKCNEIEVFIACMAIQTPSCEEQGIVGSFVQQEIQNDVYEECFDDDRSPTTTTATSPVTYQTPIPTTRPTTTGDATGVTFPSVPTSPSHAAATTVTVGKPILSLADFENLKKDLQAELSRQTKTLTQKLTETLSSLQRDLPSKIFLRDQLDHIKSQTSALETSLKEEFAQHSQKLESLLQSLLDDLQHKMNQAETMSSQTNSVYNDSPDVKSVSAHQPNSPPSLSCVQRVLDVLAEVSAGDTLSVEHYVKVSQLGMKGENSNPQSVMVMFSRRQDRMVIFIKGREAFQKAGVSMEMFPNYVRFTCAM